MGDSVKKYKTTILYLLLFSIIWSVILLPVTTAKYIYSETHSFFVGTQMLFRKEFAFTGEMERYVIEHEGLYVIQAWGGDGGDACMQSGYLEENNNCKNSGGTGGYTIGQIYLDESFVFIIYVGGRGGDGDQIISDHDDFEDISNGGYNGGGNGYSTIGVFSNGGGGGSTEIGLERLGLILKDSRIIVAGGGGGGTIESNEAIQGGFGGNFQSGLDFYTDDFSDAFTDIASETAQEFIKTEYGDVYGVAGQMETDFISPGGQIDAGSLKNGESVPVDDSDILGGGGGSGYYGGHAMNNRSGGGGSSVIRLGVCPLEELGESFDFSHIRPRNSQITGHGHVIVTYLGEYSELKPKQLTQCSCHLESL